MISRSEFVRMTMNYVYHKGLNEQGTIPTKEKIREAILDSLEYGRELGKAEAAAALQEHLRRLSERSKELVKPRRGRVVNAKPAHAAVE